MSVTAETLAILKQALSEPSSEIAKAWTQSSGATTGITAYNLEAPSKKLYPVITPLRNDTPRIKAVGGIQANWKAITAINTQGISLGVSGGQRGGVNSTTEVDYLAAFKGCGLEDYVHFEADYAAEGFEDVKALAVEGLLRATMIGEEFLILGGQSTWAIGQGGQPVLTPAITGGSLTNAASPYTVAVVPLTLEGYRNATVSAAGVPQSVTRTNIDQTTDTFGGGSGKPSATQTATIASGVAGSITATTADVPGAVAYAWYLGTAGAAYLTAITTANTVVLTASNTTNQLFSSLAATDFSANTLEFDGMLTMASKAGSGSYYATLNGAVLTSDSAGGIVEIDAALKSFWDNYRLSPDEIWVNSQEQLNISKKILTGSATSAQTFMITTDQGNIRGGALVRSYLNKYCMDGAQEIPIKLHPNLPPGVIFIRATKPPYKISNVGNVCQMLLRRDYYQIEWPRTKRRYEYGVYFDGVLQHYFPPAIGIIKNIGNG